MINVHTLDIILIHRYFYNTYSESIICCSMLITKLIMSLNCFTAEINILNKVLLNQEIECEAKFLFKVKRKTVDVFF